MKYNQIVFTVGFLALGSLLFPAPGYARYSSMAECLADPTMSPSKCRELFRMNRVTTGLILAGYSSDSELVPCTPRNPEYQLKEAAFFCNGNGEAEAVLDL